MRARKKIEKQIRNALCALLGLALLGLAGCSADTPVDELFTAETEMTALNYESAIAHAELAAQSSDREEARRAYRLKGIALMKCARYDEAEEAFLEALALSDGILSDTDIDISLYRALALRGKGELQAADTVYGQILALKPRNTAALYARGCNALAMGDLSAAAAAFDKAEANTASGGERFELQVRIYEAFAEAGYAEAGAYRLSQARSTYGNGMDAYDKGRIAFYLGNPAEAQSHLEEAFRTARGEERVECALLLGQIAEAQGDAGYAATVYESALEEGAHAAELYNRRGLLRMAQGDYAGAVDDFESGLRLNDNTVTQALLRNRITAYEYAGNFAQAALLMESYIQYYPDDPEAAREAVFLRTR